MRGAVGFTTHRTSLLSKAVRLITRSKMSHSFIVYSMKPQKLILEADGYQVAFHSFDKKYETKNTKYEIYAPLKVTVAQINAALENTIEEFDGKAYGWLQLVGLLGVIILSRMGIKTENWIPLGSICSEVDWFYLKELKPKLFSKYDRNSVSPEDLYKVIVENPKHFVLIERKDFE